ncbi:MAG: hypothetical protein SGPRY_011587, partial [Prymnesium sp.]
LASHILNHERFSIPSYRCRAQLDIACFLAKEAGGSCGAEIEALRARLGVLAALQAGNITIFEAYQLINSSDPRGDWVLGLGSATHNRLLARAFFTPAHSCTGAHPFWTERAISRAFEPPTIPTWEWEVDDLALAIYLQPDQYKFTPELALAFHRENVRGADWLSSSFNQLDTLMERFNLTYGRAKEIIEVSDFFDALIGQPIKYSPFFPQGSDYSLKVHASLTRLSDVNAPSFFESEWQISLTWEDPRIVASCPDMKDGEEPPYYVVDSDGISITDKRTTLFPGSEPSWLGVATSNPSKYLNKSFGAISMRILAKATVVMDYRNYPRDEQLFTLNVRLSDLVSSEVAHLELTSSLEIPAKSEHPVWEVIEVFSSTVNSSWDALPAEEDVSPEVLARLQFNPGFSYIQRLQKENVFVASEGVFQYSSASLHIRARRLMSFYVFNYIVVQAMLVSLGFACFALSRDATDTRLTVSMGLILSINVFQVVLVENNPETGYLTRLMRYTVCNEALLLMIAAHAVLIRHCHLSHMRQLETRCTALISLRHSFDLLAAQR